MRGLAKIVCVSLLCLGAVACGGGANDAPPKPLSTHIDDMFIARIPLDQKQSVVQTQNDWSVAKMENATAEAQLQETEAQLHQAKNDQKATRLQIDSAVSAKKSAEASADMNRINNAQKELHAAEDLGKAADAHIKYLDSYHNYLKRYARYTAENMYWREAQYESAKATLAKANSIQPKGVDYNNFPKQLEDRQKRTQTAKEKVEAEKQKAVSAREAWLNIQKSADTESGHPTMAWDPMAPKGAGPTTTATGGGDKPDTTPKPLQQPAGEGSGTGSATPQ